MAVSGITIQNKVLDDKAPECGWKDGFGSFQDSFFFSNENGNGRKAAEFCCHTALLCHNLEELKKNVGNIQFNV